MRKKEMRKIAELKDSYLDCRRRAGSEEAYIARCKDRTAYKHQGCTGQHFFASGQEIFFSGRGGARVKPSRGGAFSGQGKKTVKQ